MNRVMQAWLALTGRLEPEVREVPVLGTPEPCDVYVVNRVVEDDVSCCYALGLPFPLQVTKPIYYTTCEQAHKENPGVNVTKVAMWRIGGRYFTDLKVKEVAIQPKPKRAKGR